MTDVHALLGQALGASYHVERELGGGGMSRVFLARDVALDRSIVIKLLPEDAAATLSAERFKREIAVAAKLQHPHIVPLLSAGEVDGLPFFTMPFVEGESLRERLARQGELPIDEAVQILKEVARALAYAHEHGIVHRDIKPDNVMISGGASMVSDFGVAKAVTASSNQTTSGGLTQLGVALGTPAYMAPEQATGEATIDHRADIYALGCMAYELVTGHPPFSGRNAQSLLAAHVSEEPEPVQRRRPTVPAPFAALVMQCLEKRPADRPKNAQEVLRALDAIVVTPHSTSSYAAAAARMAYLDGSWLRDWRSLALIVAAVTSIAFGVRGVVASSAHPKTSVFSMISFIDGTQMASDRGFALSPDGLRFVFVARPPDSSTYTLWIRSLDSPSAMPLTGTSNATYPFWSPDGRRIGYFANGSLRIRTVDGAEERALCPVEDPEGGSWGSRDIIVFAPAIRGTIHAVSANGGECRAVTTLTPGVLDHRRPSFLPDGRHFVFGSGSGARISLGDVETGSMRPLVSGAGYGDYVDPGYLFFANPTLQKLFAQRLDPRTGKLVGDAVPILNELGFTVSSRALFSARATNLLAVIARSSPSSLVRVGPDGGPSVRHQLDQRVGTPQVLNLSRDASQIALGAKGLWLYDVERDVATMVVAGSDTGAVAIGASRWSPGDTAIVYTRTAGGDLGVRLHSFRTGEDRPLIPSLNTTLWADDWSEDGNRLLLHSSNVMATNVVNSVLDLRTGKFERILTGRPASGAAFSQDARWVAFNSRESGRSEVYIMNLRSGVPIRVTRDGGVAPIWRVGEIFYRTPNVGLMTVAVQLGEKPRFGQPRIVVADTNYVAFTVSRDGRTIWGLHRQTRRAMTLIQNWRSRLP